MTKSYRWTDFVIRLDSEYLFNDQLFLRRTLFIVLFNTGPLVLNVFHWYNRCQQAAKRAAAVQKYLATVPSFAPVSYEIFVHNPATPGINAEFSGKPEWRQLQQEIYSRYLTIRQKYNTTKLDEKSVG